MATASAEAAAARINEEQLFHELEKKYLLLRADYAVLEQERDGVVAQKTEAVTQAKQLEGAIERKDGELLKLKEELMQLRVSRDQLGFQAKAAASQAERRLEELEDLQKTVKEQSKQLMESQRREVEALQRAAAQDSLVEPLRHSVTRLTKELETTKQHLEWMDKQVADKSQLIQELRVSSTKIAQESEEAKAQHTDELSAVRRQLESARQISKKLESSLVQTKEQVKELQATRAHDEERLQNELSAQRRLADLYKDSAEDAHARVNELQDLCESLRRSLVESEDALAHQEERTKQHVEGIFREQADASERRIQSLQDELKEAHERLEQLQQSKLFSLRTASAVSEMSSSAGAAHLAAHGLSPKELCDQILALETELRSERDEKEQLKICMDRVVREVHEKAPMIMELKLNLERSVASNTQMSERYEACLQELSKHRARERHAQQDKQTYERKCEALAKSVDDLSRQVQHLLFRAQETSQSSGGMFGETVAENLVVFKDIEELQIRNQQLLMVIRELTESKKKLRLPSGAANGTHIVVPGESEDESDADIDASSAISKRLAFAQKEIEELRAEREEEREMIGAIVKQRDMYRVLLAQADGKFAHSAEVPSGAAPTGIDPAASSQHHRRASTELNESKTLRELHKEFETYKKEKQTNVKMLQETLDHARTEANALRLAKMQAEVEAKCNKDRFEVAEKRRADADEEILRLRTKVEQSNALLVQHQTLLSENERKLENAVTRLRALEVEKDGAIREVSFLKQHESKILQDLAAVRLDNTNLLRLMDTNRQIESSREVREERETQRIGQKLATVEAKLQEAYDKMEANEALAGAKLAAEEQAKKIAVAETTEAKEQLVTVREQLVRLEEQSKSAVSKNELLEKDVAYLREQLRKGANVAATERVAALEVQLRQSQSEVQSALEMKKSLTEAVTKYKAVAEANEKSLLELSAASDKWKAEFEAKFDSVKAERDAARVELEKVRSRVNEDIVEGNKLREEMDAMVRDHQAAIQQSQARQRQLEFDASSARTELAAVQSEISTLREDVTIAQENYERELKLHASQIERYSQSRKLLQDEQTKGRALLSEVNELKARVHVAEQAASDKVSSMEKLVADANNAKKNLAEQNKLLHTQLERANQQLRRAHEAEMVQRIGEPSGASDPSASSATEREHAKELDDLRSVIAFLRKESEIVSSKFEVSHQENQRHLNQISVLEATIERLREEIKRTEQGKVSLSSLQQGEVTSEAAKQAAKLEQFDLLRESNATLREECQKTLSQLKIEEQRVKNLEQQLAPLRSSEALLKAQIESLKQDIGALTDANARWKQRVEQLVEKYQQIDPAEHERVCAEKDAAVKELTELQAKESALRAEVETVKASEGKINEETKLRAENLQKQYERVKTFAKNWKSKAEAHGKQAEEKAAQLAECEKRLAAVTAEKAALEAKVATAEVSGNAAATAASAATSVASAAWEKEKHDINTRLEAETKKMLQLKDMNNKLLNGLKGLKHENAQLKNQLSTLAAAKPPSDSTAPDAVATVNASPATTAAATPPVTDAQAAPQPPLPSSTRKIVAKSVNASPAATAAAIPPASEAPGAPQPPLPSATQKIVAKSQLTAVAAPFVPVTTQVLVSPPVSTTVAPVPAKSPPRVPAPAPVVVPALKVNAAPLAAATPAPPLPVSKPASAVPVASVAKADEKELTPAVESGAGEPSAEEKLRLSALQSMKKQFQKPAGTTPVKPAAATSVAPPSIVKPPLPPQPSAAHAVPSQEVEDEKMSDAKPDTAAIKPAAFGLFGSGGASGLVFGKPGITLPIPASPTTTLASTAATTSTAAAATSVVFASPTSAPAVPASDAPAAVGSETEAVRRSQRLARFSAASEAAALAAPAQPSLKRPASDAPSNATPQKIAKLAGENARVVEDSQETEVDESQPGVGSADETETETEDNAVMGASPPPSATE